ncbi:MAG: restriction endonuclease subunit S [Acidimicrobiia bacterium]|nr:restriction endonuclease subunit S [Acidimicrobiia bacterium]
MSRHLRVSLGDVLRLDRDEVAIEPTAIYRTAGIRSFGRGLFARPAISGAGTSYAKYYRLRKDQLVFSRLFAWEGAVALVPPEFDGWFVSSEFPTFAVNRARVTPAYLGHFVRWPHFHDQLADSTRGLGQRRQRVHVEDFLALNLPLPPLDEQRRIAATLDRWRLNTDLLLTRLQLPVTTPEATTARLPSLLDEVLRQTSEDQAPVGDLVEFISDTVHPGDDPSPARSFVGLQHVESHTGQMLDSSPIGNEKGRKFRFRPGDVVYGYLRPYLNKVWVADRDGLCSVDQYVLRPNAGVSAELLAHQLRSMSVLDQAVDLTHNLQLPRLRSGLLAAITVQAVRPESAAEVVGRLDRVRNLVIARAELRKRQIAAASALMPSLLNQAFAGLS